MPSIRNFMTAVPASLREQLLARPSVELDENLKLGDVGNLVSAIEVVLDGLPPGTRGQFMNDIDTVSRMATEPGETAIASATLHEHLDEFGSRQARALWVFLNDREGFRRAEESLFNDQYRYGRQWTAFGGAKGRDLLDSKEGQEAFKQALRIYFNTPNVHLDIFARWRRRFHNANTEDGASGNADVSLVQITIYREDLPNLEPAFIDGEFGMVSRRRVLEAAVTYEALSGRIECVARQAADRDEVVRQFATAMLGSEPYSEPALLRSYDLSVLSERQAFNTDADDLIEDVSVAMLRLNPADAPEERITIERAGASTRDIWSIVDDRLGDHALRSTYRISQARIAIRYRTRDSNRRQTLNITITHPYRSNIKDQREIERLVAAKYLPRWKLVTAA
jgi:hypothetical protein